MHVYLLFSLTSKRSGVVEVDSIRSADGVGQQTVNWWVKRVNPY